MSLTPNPPLNPKITRFYVPANIPHCSLEGRANIARLAANISPMALFWNLKSM